MGALGKIRNLKWIEDYIASDILWQYGIRDEIEFEAEMGVLQNWAL